MLEACPRAQTTETYPLPVRGTESKIEVQAGPSPPKPPGTVCSRPLLPMLPVAATPGVPWRADAFLCSVSLKDASSSGSNRVSPVSCKDTLTGLWGTLNRDDLVSSLHYSCEDGFHTRTHRRLHVAVNLGSQSSACSAPGPEREAAFPAPRGASEMAGGHFLSQWSAPSLS